MIIASRNKKLSVSTPLIMGILNVTPDSFSDGGKHLSPDRAFAAAKAMVDAGVHIIDIGGESTRPGFEPISAEEELQRVIPVIKRVRALPVWISLDSYKTDVMREAIPLGVDMINDIHALQDEAALQLVAKSGVATVLMHTFGSLRDPHRPPSNPDYFFQQLFDYLSARIKLALSKGIQPKSIVIDPGIGFGKTAEQGTKILARIDLLLNLGYPVLIGCSKKRLLKSLLPEAWEASELLALNLASACWTALFSNVILRVHDVKETLLAVKFIQKMRELSLAPFDEPKL